MRKEAWLWALFFTVTSLFINDYYYGTGDHSSMVPFVKHALNPELYPGDFLIGQSAYYTTFLWPAMAKIAGALSISVPVLFFLGTMLAMYFVFAAFYLLGYELFGSHLAAFSACFFLQFFKPALAGMWSFEPIFLARIAAFPWILFALLFAFRRNWLAAFALVGVAFSINAVFATFAFVILLGALAVTWRETDKKRSLFAIGVFLLLALPVIMWRFSYGDPAISAFRPDPTWMELTRIRTGHHVFPTTWPLDEFFRAALFMLAFAIGCKYRPPQPKHAIALGMAGAVLLMWLGGFVFAELIPFTLAIQVQPFRSSPFLVHLAILYFGNYFARELTERSSLGDRLATVAASVALLYFANLWKHVVVLLAGLAILLYLVRRMTLVGPSLAYRLGAVGISCFMALYGFLLWDGIDIGGNQDADFVAVQDWARESTPIDAAFIVPPYTQGFRVESERTSFGDWKDGTLHNYNLAFGVEWLARMRRLGYGTGDDFAAAYNELTADDLLEIGDEYGLHYVITERADLPFPRVFANGRWIVYELISAEQEPAAP